MRSFPTWLFSIAIFSALSPFSNSQTTKNRWPEKTGPPHDLRIYPCPGRANPMDLTNSPGVAQDEYGAIYGPEGKRIYYVHGIQGGGQKLFSMHAGGTGKTLVSPPPPGGTRNFAGLEFLDRNTLVVGFHNLSTGKGEFWTYNMAGKKWTLFYTAAGGLVHPFALSPDRSRMAWVEGGGSYKMVLYSMPLPGCPGAGKRTVLLNSSSGISPYRKGFAWAPDGKRIYFTGSFGSNPVKKALFSMNPDVPGTSTLRLEKVDGDWPSISPDGRWMCYREVDTKTGQTFLVFREIHNVLPIQGLPVVVLGGKIAKYYECSGAAWNPRGGTSLVYTNGTSGLDKDIWKVDFAPSLVPEGPFALGSACNLDVHFGTPGGLGLITFGPQAVEIPSLVYPLVGPSFNILSSQFAAFDSRGRYTLSIGVPKDITLIHGSYYFQVFDLDIKGEGYFYRMSPPLHLTLVENPLNYWPSRRTTWGLWKFDGNYKDSSAYGRNGTGTRGLCFVKGMNNGKAVRFPAGQRNREMIRIPMGSSNQPWFGRNSTSWTLEFWVKPRAVPKASKPEGAFIACTKDTIQVTMAPANYSQGTPFNAVIPGYVRFLYRTIFNNQAAYVGSRSVPIGKWHHVAVEFDYKSKTNYLFLNGGFQGEFGPWKVPPPADLIVGNHFSLPYNFEGDIGEVRLSAGLLFRK